MIPLHINLLETHPTPLDGYEGGCQCMLGAEGHPREQAMQGRGGAGARGRLHLHCLLPVIWS
jgi:hypothetical protein